MTNTRIDEPRPTLESTTPAVCNSGVTESGVNACGGRRENSGSWTVKLLGCMYSYVAGLLILHSINISMEKLQSEVIMEPCQDEKTGSEQTCHPLLTLYWQQKMFADLWKPNALAVSEISEFECCDLFVSISSPRWHKKRCQITTIIGLQNQFLVPMSDLLPVSSGLSKALWHWSSHHPQSYHNGTPRYFAQSTN